MDPMESRDGLTAKLTRGYRLPILTQPDFIRRALKAGKHVLSEKPIAANVKLATELQQWYEKEIDSTKVSWAVAENYRYHEELAYAASFNTKLGKLLQFHVRAHRYVKDDGKYFCKFAIVV